MILEKTLNSLFKYFLSKTKLNNTKFIDPNERFLYLN